MTFILDEIPEDVQEVVTEKEMRCMHPKEDGPHKGEPCGRLLAMGKPPPTPISLICWRCKKTSTFKYIG